MSSTSALNASSEGCWSEVDTSQTLATSGSVSSYTWPSCTSPSRRHPPAAAPTARYTSRPVASDRSRRNSQRPDCSMASNRWAIAPVASGSDEIQSFPRGMAGSWSSAVQ